jgi:tRNA threonylcarbamoyladenosine biosynthesis protein TsaE
LPLTLTLRGQRDTEALARAIAPHLRAGDLVGLVGGLGAGKSVFARALIRARLAALGRDEPIPSPTYTLVQVYDLATVELWHADLYRLGGPGELVELGLLDALDRAICVVEWADRLSPAPERRLVVTLGFDAAGEEVRTATVEACGGGWAWLAEAVAA